MIHLSIIEAETRDVAGPAEGKTLEDRFKAIAKKAKGHWMFTDETKQFQGAVASLYQHATEEEKPSIKRAVDLQRALGAAVSGVPVDLAAMLGDGEPEPVPLMKWWRDE